MSLERLELDDGTVIEYYPVKEAPPTPPAPQAPTPEVALLEALAEQGESINDLKEQLLTLMEAMAEKEES